MIMIVSSVCGRSQVVILPGVSVAVRHFGSFRPFADHLLFFQKYCICNQKKTKTDHVISMIKESNGLNLLVCYLIM